MTDSNKIKNIIDKIANLQEIGNETSLFEYAEYTNNKSMAIAMCFRLISQLFINLFIVLPILKPGNKISEAVNSVISNFNDNSIGTLLDTIYNEVNREPENFDDYIYQEHVMVICKQIKMISDYIIADSSICDGIINEASYILPSMLWWVRLQSTIQKDTNKNEVK